MQVIPSGRATDPGETLGDMESARIVIVATLELPEITPAPAGNPNFPDTTLPFDVSSLDRQDSWEGQLQSTPVRYQGRFRVNDQYLRLDLYVGSRGLSAELLNEAQLELCGLRVPQG